jgi:hypothetical protein
VSAAAAAGALIVRAFNGRVWFSVNGRTGDGFPHSEGFLEIDVKVGTQ